MDAPDIKPCGFTTRTGYITAIGMGLRLSRFANRVDNAEGGGLLLIWIGLKLLTDEEEEEEMEASSNTMTAIKTIIIADLIMSLDNILTVAAA